MRDVNVDWRGVQTEYTYSDDGDITISTSQDCQPILDRNKELANEPLDKRKDIWRVASIPPVVQMKWLVEEGIDVFDPEHAPAVRKKLNSNEWRYLRTSEIIL